MLTPHPPSYRAKCYASVGVLHGRVVRLKQGVTGRLLRIGRVRSPDRTTSRGPNGQPILIDNLAYLWFYPGRTRFKVRGGKHWLQTEDPERYPTITDDLLIELFYPTSTVKQRKVLASRARQALEQLVEDGEARIVKGRLMPPAPGKGR